MLYICLLLVSIDQHTDLFKTTVLQSSFLLMTDTQFEKDGWINENI